MDDPVERRSDVGEDGRRTEGERRVNRSKVELGVNIDHVATLRQARRTYEPDPIAAAKIAEMAGAEVITVHLREDRRHIQDRDVRLLKDVIAAKYNFELSCSEEIVGIAVEVHPEQATLVPEKREEVTTEGGLDLFGERKRVERAIDRLKEKGVRVSLFLDPEPKQIEAAIGLGVEAVELHTGTYALAKGESQRQQWERLVAAGRLIQEGGLRLHAGHGLNYFNVQPVAAIEGMRELNIGHAIVARAVFVGLHEAIREMKRLIDQLPPVLHWF